MSANNVSYNVYDTGSLDSNWENRKFTIEHNNYGASLDMRPEPVLIFIVDVTWDFRA